MPPSDQQRLEFLGSIFDLRGRTALVTGAGSGIGATIAGALASAGASVVVADLDFAAAKTVADKVGAVPAEVDVADVEQLAAAFDLAPAPVDIVFANAGISGGRGPDGGQSLGDVPIDVWDRALRTNLTGAFNTMQEAARRMRSRGEGGRIVVTSSIAGMRGDPMVGYPYAASKAAVVNLVRQAAIDLGAENILVNAILPGPFGGTNIGAPAESPGKIALMKKFATTVPLGRVADLDEMRGLALFLASPASSFVTGTTFAIDGGSLAGRFDEPDVL